MAESAQNTNPSENLPLRRRINEELRARGRPDLDEEEDLEEEEEEEIESGVRVNIFDFCNQFMESGDVIQYDIDRNGSFVAMKNHPYSWEKLQSELGEGHYRVQAKSAITKQYRKQETRFVTAAVVKEKETTVADAVRAALPPQVDPHDQLMKTATLLRSLQPSVPEDKTGPMMIEFMKTMMTMQQTAQSTTMTMIEKMQENTNRLIEKMDNSNKDMMTKLENKLTSGKPEKSMDALQVLDMLRKAEERGMSNYLRIDELAEKKAARLGGGGHDDEKEPESATERLIKSVLPAVTAALQAPRPPTVQVRRQMPARPAHIPTPTPNPPAPAQAAPAAPKPAPAPRGPAVPQVMPKVTKEAVLEQLAPIVFPKMIEAEPVKNDPVAVARTQKAAAEEVKKAGTSMGLTVSSLLTIVSIGDIIDIATSAGLPPEAHIWLKGFYANLKELAGASPGPQPGSVQAQSK